MTFLHYAVGMGLVLGLMILVHEWGHFAMARFFKVRVDVFSIGFGPRLFGWKRGDTDYRLSALPLGGYVRMAGQDLTEIDSADQAPTGAPDELMSKPRWQRALISFAGPAVNLVLPIFLLTGLFTIKGVPYSSYLDQPVQIVYLSSDKDAPKSDLRPGDILESVNGATVTTWDQAYKAIQKAGTAEPLNLKVTSDGATRNVSVAFKNPDTAELVLGYPPRQPVLDEVGGGSPAQRAGLQDGDVIVAVDGQPTKYWGQFVDRVRGSGGKTLAVNVSRKGQIVHANVTPELNATENGESSYQVGVSVLDETLYRRVSLTESVRDSMATTGLTIQKTAEVVGMLFRGKVSIKQLQGPVGISHAAARAVDRGSLAVISLMVLISVNLGILNLLPIPILDGGNILLLAIEGVLRRDLSMSFKERFVQVGFLFLLVLFAIVMYHDVARRLSAHS
jgi:regulator of sigma E protease